MHPVQGHRLRLERYHTPGTLDEAVTLLAASGGNARVVAGGTDLLLELTRGLRPEVGTLIDVGRIPGFDRIEIDGEIVSLGAGVTHAQVISSALLVDRGLPLAQACLEIGSPQLRNRATVAGNLITASPANDTISALRALGAELSLVSAGGSRVVRLSEFHTGVRRSVLGWDELVTEIRFPVPGPNQRGVFAKLGLRRSQAISVVHMAAMLSFDGTSVTGARIMLGSVAPTIVAAGGAERFLVGSEFDPVAIAEAARLAAAEVTPIDDLRATAGYRTEQVRVMVGRALTALLDRTERDRWPDRSPILATRVAAPAGDPLADTGTATAIVGATDTITATVNGHNVEAGGAVSKTLLDWLRDDAGPALGIALTGAKEGCAEGECGACTVILDGMAVMSCLVPAPRAAGSEIVTIEGLAREGAGLHPLQQAFIDQGAVQCGYCIPGFLMAGSKLLDELPHPSRDEIRAGLAGNLCRCTGYYKIVAALEQAAGRA